MFGCEAYSTPKRQGRKPTADQNTALLFPVRLFQSGGGEEQPVAGGVAQVQTGGAALKADALRFQQTVHAFQFVCIRQVKADVVEAQGVIRGRGCAFALPGVVADVMVGYKW